MNLKKQNKDERTEALSSVAANSKIQVKMGGQNAREQRIKNCEWCGGNPETEPINLPDWEGTKCANPDCYEVIEATKVQ